MQKKNSGARRRKFSGADFETRQGNWIQQFVKDYPRDERFLSKKGINSDKTYVKAELKLPPALRQKLALYRHSHILGKFHDDPCCIARYSPPWFRKVALGNLNLPKQITTALQSESVKTVGDLGKHTSSKLFKQSRIDRKDQQKIVEALKDALAAVPGQKITKKVGNFKKNNLFLEFRKVVSRFPDRMRDVLSRRLGLNSPSQSLQEIGDLYGVTRERIRQIEAKALRRLLKDTELDDLLLKSLTKLVRASKSPVNIDKLNKLDKRFDDISTHREFFMKLVGAICNGKLSFVEVKGERYITLMNLDSWQKSIASAKSMLSEMVGKNMSEKSVRNAIAKLLPSEGKELEQLLWEISSKNCHYSNLASGKRILSSFGTGTEHRIEAILNESKTPLHYTEIAALASTKLKKDVDIRTAHNAAAKVGFLFGPGKFGLKKHIKISDAQLTSVRSAAEELMLSKTRSKQWHAAEMVLILSKSMKQFPKGMDKYVLDITLRDSDILKNLGRMTWILAGAKTNRTKRMKIYDRIVSVLKSKGGPMTTQQIISKLTTSRGLNETFQIVARGEVIKLKSGMWGLKGRD